MCERYCHRYIRIQLSRGNRMIMKPNEKKKGRMKSETINFPSFSLSFLSRSFSNFSRFFCFLFFLYSCFFFNFYFNFHLLISVYFHLQSLSSHFCSFKNPSFGFHFLFIFLFFSMDKLFCRFFISLFISCFILIIFLPYFLSF